MRKYFTKLFFVCSVMLAAAVAMWPSVHNDFAWDDPNYVGGNHIIKTLSLHSVKRMLTEPHFGLYKPVTILSFAVNYRLAELDPRPYHITNVVLHSVNAALVFVLLVMLISDGWVAFVCALFFAVHPMHVESVAWISERKDMLYALFFLLSSIFYIKYVRGGGWGFLALSVGGFLLSLCAKPMGITLPAVLFVYDYLLNRPFSRRLLVEKVPHVLTAGLFGAVTYFMLHSAKQIRDDFSLVDRILFVFYGLKFYIGKLLLPVNLSALYSLPVKKLGVGLPLEYWFSPVTVLCVMFILLKYCRRDRIIMGGAVFYVLTVSPVLQFVGVGPVITADRYTYIPSLGLFLPLVWYALLSIKRLHARWRGLGVGAAVCLAGLLVSLGLASRARCEVWRNSTTLFRDAAIKTPSVHSLKCYGLALAQDRHDADVLRVFDMALTLAAPVRLTDSNINDVLDIYLGIVSELKYQNRLDVARSIVFQLQKYAPWYPPLVLELADIDADDGNYQAAVRKLFVMESADCFKEDVYVRLGDICRLRGVKDRAAEFYGKTLAINPGNARALAGLKSLNVKSK